MAFADKYPDAQNEGGFHIKEWLLTKKQWEVYFDMISFLNMEVSIDENYCTL